MQAVLNYRTTSFPNPSFQLGTTVIHFTTSNGNPYIWRLLVLVEDLPNQVHHLNNYRTFTAILDDNNNEF